MMTDEGVAPCRVRTSEGMYHALVCQTPRSLFPTDIVFHFFSSVKTFKTLPIKLSILGYKHQKEPRENDQTNYLMDHNSNIYVYCV